MKKSVLLPGAIALMLAVAPMLAAQARPHLLAQQPNQTQPNTQRGNRLNLTDTQRQQMKQIRDSVQADIVNSVLNSDQRSQYQAAIGRGEKPGKAMRSLNLSADQKTQIRTKKQAAATRIRNEVLTQAQRDQLDQMRANRATRSRT